MLSIYQALLFNIDYYDVDGEYVSESFYFDTYSKRQAFYHNFVRPHIKNSGPEFEVQSLEQVYRCRILFAKPLFVVARKVNRYWRVNHHHPLIAEKACITYVILMCPATGLPVP